MVRGNALDTRIPNFSNLLKPLMHQLAENVYDVFDQLLSPGGLARLLGFGLASIYTAEGYMLFFALIFLFYAIQSC